MGYEVDFIPATSGGAAVAVRWGSDGNYKVLVYDGGTRITGERLVQHVRSRYLSGRVDYLVSSHPRIAHLEGLLRVVEELEVGEVWMHRPWARRDDLPDELLAGRTLERTALERQIPVHEPFEHARIGAFQVLSPQREWYLRTLLPAFGRPTRPPPGATLADLSRLMRLATAWDSRSVITDTPARERGTAADRESSVVLYGEFAGRGVLLTGSAGLRALSRAADCAERLGLDLPAHVRLFQPPHHGHPEHLSGPLLDRLVGPRRREGVRTTDKAAFVTLARELPAFGHTVLAQALWQRGVLLHTGSPARRLHQAFQMPDRGWDPAFPNLPPPRGDA